MLGIDIVEIKRIKDLKNRELFLEKIFTEREISYIREKKFPEERIAGMFAAKEAVIKAGGKNFKDIEIRRSDKKPYAICEGEIYELSISHEKKFAVAIAQKIDKINLKKFKFDFELLFDITKRDDYGHKGSFGKIAVIAGSKEMTGCGYLSSMAALRSGAGLVYNIVPEEIKNEIASIHREVISFGYGDVTELSKFLDGVDVIAIGPGIGTEDEKFEVLKPAVSKKLPTVIDADGLTLLSRDLTIIEGRRDIVLTPHLGEFERLTKRDLKKTDREELIELAVDFARELKINLVLKGKNTIITDGYGYYENKSGNSGMATAGSGDVLTGITAAFLKRFQAFDAAKKAVHIHALAGDFASAKFSKTSMIASDILNSIADVFLELEDIYG